MPDTSSSIPRGDCSPAPNASPEAAPQPAHSWPRCSLGSSSCRGRPPELLARAGSRVCPGPSVSAARLRPRRAQREGTAQQTSPGERGHGATGRPVS